MTYILGHTSFTSSNFEIKKISKLYDISVEIGKLNLAKETDYFPIRSDQKVMRDDVKMSIVTAQEILNKYGFSNETISKMSLFITNGSFLGNFEKHLSRVLNVFKDVYEGSSRKEIYKKIYRVSPPLLALETLTNSNMSFIAQYTGLKGNNATFGNTSISTYYALKQGINEINKGEEYTLVSSSNDASIYSHLMNRTIGEINSIGKESSAGGHIILSKKQKKDCKVSCKITRMSNIKKVPKLYDQTQTIKRTWIELIQDYRSEIVIFSGALDNETNYQDQEYFKTLNIPSFSIFAEYGFLGVSNLTFGIIQGIKHIENGFKIIDVLDRDIYGRESLIRLESC